MGYVPDRIHRESIDFDFVTVDIVECVADLNKA
jgi:hypothetical protein